jgi:hypothetical protein
VTRLRLRLRRPAVPPVAVRGVPSTAVAAAVLVLAAASRGEVLVLGILLCALRPRPSGAVAVASALAASSWRWGTTSLEALAGAQAVLGPAGVVGPVPAAAGSWLAGAAVLLALGRRPEPLPSAAIGVVVAAVVAGPAPGGDLPLRVLVAVAAGAAALGLGAYRAGRRHLDGPLAWVGAAAGMGALVSVSADAPSWPPAIELTLVVEGVAVAVAAAAIAGVVATAAQRARWREHGVPPIVMRPRAGASAGRTALPR